MPIRSLLLTVCVLSAVVRVGADQPPPAVAVAPAPGQAPRASTPTPAPAVVQVERPRRTGQPINIKIDVTIADQREGGTPLKKTMSVVTGDGMSGFIRTQAAYSSAGEVFLNVDAEPEILLDGKIRVRVNLQYDLPEKAMPTEPGGYGRLIKTQIRENLALILESGKPIVATQSADPAVDRQVTIEVKATILK
jgi:hypothetical protein